MRATTRWALSFVLLVTMALGGVSVSFAAQETSPYEGVVFGEPAPTFVDTEGDLLVMSYSNDGLGDWNGFVIYDINDRMSPSSYATETVAGSIWDVLLDGDTLYVAADSLLVYDVHLPWAPALVDSGTISNPFRLAIEGDTLFVGRWSPAEVASVDVSDPQNPVALDAIAVGSGNVNSLDTSGDLVACGVRNGGNLTLIDASVPTALAELDSVSGSTMEVRFVDDYLASAQEYAVVTWDISTPADVTTMSVAPFPQGAWCMDESNGYLGVGQYTGIVSTFGVPDSDTLDPLPDYMMPGRPYDIALNGYYLYVAGVYGGPSVVHIAAPGDEIYAEGIAGDDRYATAVDSSRRAFPDGADTVVIATGENWPDALGGSALAGAVGGPILLTRTASLRTSVLDEIERLGATKAIILGGTAAVGPAVETALKTALGDGNVDRVAGDNRYETAELIAQAIYDLGAHSDTAFIATGKDYPDAAAAAPVAAANAWPILLVPASGLPTSTVTKMDDLGIEYAIILGGDAAVTPAVEQDLLDELGEGNYERLEGSNRYRTAGALGSWAARYAGMTWNGLGISTGESFPDALTGGVVQGRTRSLMLLTKPTSVPAGTSEKLTEINGRVGAVRFFGGTSAVGSSVRAQIISLLE